MPNAVLINDFIDNTIALQEVMQLSGFQIRPDKRETENKTIRFPVKLVEEIEKAIRGKDVTFSGFVLQACRYALDNLKE